MIASPPYFKIGSTTSITRNVKKSAIFKAFSSSIVTVILNFPFPIVVGVNSVLTAHARAAIVAYPTLENRELS